MNSGLAGASAGIKTARSKSGVVYPSVAFLVTTHECFKSILLISDSCGLGVSPESSRITINDATEDVNAIIAWQLQKSLEVSRSGIHA